MKKALFYISAYNNVDYISPIVYKLGKRNNILIDVIVTPAISASDYRISALKNFENVKIKHLNSDYSQFSRQKQLVYILRELGRKIPTSLPQKIYNRHLKSYMFTPIPRDFEATDYSLVGFDWGRAFGENFDEFISNEDVTTVVLPHSDEPFVNRLITPASYQSFLENPSNFKKVDEHLTRWSMFETFHKYDFVPFPSLHTSTQAPKNFAKNKMPILGSPRYCREWIDVLDTIAPDFELNNQSNLKIVVFLRREVYNVHKYEVEDSLKMLDKFENICTVVKEHPSTPLLGHDFVSKLNNINYVNDDKIQSASLIKWGDVFLSLSSSIAFEPIVRKKPVLELSYAHSNNSVVSKYFDESDLKTKEDLYYRIHQLLSKGTRDFYDQENHDQFTEDIISPNNKPVLKSWASFIESNM
jgi:hypothetical protein